MFPLKRPTGICSFLFFWSPTAVGHSVLPTKMTYYGNLFMFVFLGPIAVGLILPNNQFIEV